MSAAFEGWAVVELLGHRVRYGRVSEVTMFGEAMLRVEMPTDPPTEEFYAGKALYGITPASEERIRAYHAPRRALTAGVLEGEVVVDDNESIRRRAAAAVSRSWGWNPSPRSRTTRAIASGGTRVARETMHSSGRGCHRTRARLTTPSRRTSCDRPSHYPARCPPRLAHPGPAGTGQRADLLAPDQARRSRVPLRARGPQLRPAARRDPRRVLRALRRRERPMVAAERGQTNEWFPESRT